MKIRICWNKSIVHGVPSFLPPTTVSRHVVAPGSQPLSHFMKETLVNSDGVTTSFLGQGVKLHAEIPSLEVAICNHY